MTFNTPARQASGGRLPAAASRLCWPIIVLIAVPTILLAPIVLFGRVVYWGVPLLQFYPWQQAAVEALRSGQLPLWNSLVGSGAPLAANLQSGVFYPLNVLHLILPTEFAQSYTALLHVILAGSFMYAFMRTLKVSPFAALIAAMSFQVCGFVIARLGFFSVTAAFPWIAAWLWRAERLAQGLIDQSTNRRTGGPANSAARNVMWFGLVIGLGILAGHAQTAVYGLILISGYMVWRTIAVSPRHLVIRASGHLVIAVVLGLGLAAIQLLSAAELTRESQRAGGLDAVKVLTHSYWPPRLLTLLSPDFFGNPAQGNFWGYDNYWENAAYIGVMPLLLALWMMGQGATLLRFAAGAFRPGKRPGARNKPASQQGSESMNHSPHVTHDSSLPVAFFTIATILSLTLAFGWFTPIYPFLYQTVPGFGLFQGPARWLVVTTVALCALAGFGAQRWIDRGISRRGGRRLMLIGIASSMAGFAGLFILKGSSATFGPATLRLGILLTAIGLLFQSKVQHPKSKMIVVVVFALDLLTAHFALNPSLPPDIYHAPNAAAEAIKADGNAGRVFYFEVDEEAIKFGKYLAHDRKFDGYGPTDLDYWRSEREALLPNVAMIDGVPSANNFDSLIVGRYQNLLDKINTLPFDQALSLLGRMNVAYIVSPRALDLPVVYHGRAVTIYRNAHVLPRVWIAPPDADLVQVAEVLAGSSIESLTDLGNTVTIRAMSPDDGWLIVSDVFYPGWHATMDGVAAEVQLANEAFRAVKFPAGAHQVEFRYEPMSISLGGLISLVSMIAIIIGLILTARTSGFGAWASAGSLGHGKTG